MDRNERSPPLLKTRARSNKFSLTPLSRSESNISLDTSPEADQSPSTLPSEPPTPNSGRRDSSGFHTTRSILNLTSSTLLGIYSSTGYNGSRDEPSTPWGTGAQTPARKVFEESFRSALQPLESVNGMENSDSKFQNTRSRQERPPRQPISSARWMFNFTIRVFSLFFIGLVYGNLITQIHDKGDIVPVRLEAIDRQSWYYLGFWGVASVVLGILLPAIDEMRVKRHQHHNHEATGNKGKTSSASDSEPESKRQIMVNLGADWNPIVRSIGAFVGIAFAIRRLPWQSTFQVSLTLSLVNPVMWYLIDRTKAGIALSSAVGIIGSAILLAINPTWVPSPASSSSSAPSSSTVTSGNWTSQSGQIPSSEELFIGTVSYKSIGIATWISSVLFCSCVFFGNIGRRLALIGQSSGSQRDQNGKR